MKKIVNFAFYPLIGLLIFNVFFRNHAEANGNQAYEEMLSGKAVIVDVREKDEVSQGMIKGAEWIALSDLKGNPDATIKKVRKLGVNKKIYLYCRSGSRSGTFADELKKQGLQGINLGGYSDLISQGLPSQTP